MHNMIADRKGSQRRTSKACFVIQISFLLTGHIHSIVNGRWIEDSSRLNPLVYAADLGVAKDFNVEARGLSSTLRGFVGAGHTKLSRGGLLPRETTTVELRMLWILDKWSQGRLRVKI